MLKYISYAQAIYKLRRACGIKPRRGEISPALIELFISKNPNALLTLCSESNIQEMVTKNHPYPKNIGELSSQLVQTIDKTSNLSITVEDLQENQLAKDIYSILLEIMDDVNTYIFHTEATNKSNQG